jgi:hypothetical protein
MDQNAFGLSETPPRQPAGHVAVQGRAIRDDEPRPTDEQARSYRLRADGMNRRRLKAPYDSPQVPHTANVEHVAKRQPVNGDAGIAKRIRGLAAFANDGNFNSKVVAGKGRKCEGKLVRCAEAEIGGENEN